MSGFDRFLTETATTLRLPDMTSGVRGGAAAANLSSFDIMPLIPASADVQLRSGLDTPFTAWETYADGTQDILQGDILVTPATTGSQYIIRGVEPWPWDNGRTFLHLVLEKLRT